MDLKSPLFADPSHANLSTAADGSSVFQLDAITDEAPGTYTAGLIVRTADQRENAIGTAEIQIGTATRDALSPGPKNVPFSSAS